MYLIYHFIIFIDINGNIIFFVSHKLSYREQLLTGGASRVDAYVNLSEVLSKVNQSKFSKVSVWYETHRTESFYQFLTS